MVKVAQVLFKLCKVFSNGIIAEPFCVLKVLLEKDGDKSTQLSEFLRHRLSAFDNVVRKDILLPVHPKMVEPFLCAVEDLRQVGCPGAVLLEHLSVEHLVGVGKVLPIGFRAGDESDAAHEPLDATEIRLADFYSLIVIEI